MSDAAARRPARIVLVTSAVVAAVAHVPVTPGHLREAPYLGVLFVLMTAACLGLAGAALMSQRAAVLVAFAAVCSAAIVGYVLTRLVAFPEIADDVGNWLEPFGIVSVLAETAVVIAAVRLLRSGDGSAEGLVASGSCGYDQHRGLQTGAEADQ